MKDVRLFAYWRSSASWRSRLALHLKGVEFEIVPVNLLEGANRKPEYAARNKLEQLPTLQWVQGDTTHQLTQSLAIIRYLDAVIAEPRLEPSDPLACARAWELAEIVNAGIQPIQNLRVLKSVEAMGGDRKAWGAQAIERGFAAMEAIASKSAGRCLVGDEISVADICLVPQIYNGRRFGVDISAFPTLSRVEAYLAEQPAFVAAHPDQQPDAVKEA